MIFLGERYSLLFYYFFTWKTDPIYRDTEKAWKHTTKTKGNIHRITARLIMAFKADKMVFFMLFFVIMVSTVEICSARHVPATSTGDITSGHRFAFRRLIVPVCCRYNPDCCQASTKTTTRPWARKQFASCTYGVTINATT